MRVGVDLIEIPRIARALERYPGYRERCFTAAERDYCDGRPNPAQHYAARFAGKEAVGKAVGDSKLESDGKAEKTAGKIQNALGGVRDTLRDMLKK